MRTERGSAQDNSALNIDGTAKHGQPQPTQKQTEYLRGYGFEL